MTDAAVAENYQLHDVVTTVDALLGMRTLQEHPQSVRQVAVADVVIVTKSDVPDADPQSVQRALAELNPGAMVTSASFGDVDAGLFLGGERGDPVARLFRLGAPPPPHALDITCLAFVREQPVSAVALALFLEALAEHCGDGLLRMKGIVHVKEAPGRPAVVHGVQHIFHPPEWLDHWPTADRRTRMVFIGRHPPSAAWVRYLLELLDAEVAEENARRASAA
jgi:G3E family GTPase